MVQKVIAQSGHYPECKTDIHELELLSVTCPGEYRIGANNNKLFLLKRDHTLIYGSYLIIDRRGYTYRDFGDKLKQLIEIANK